MAVDEAVEHVSSAVKPRISFRTLAKAVTLVVPTEFSKPIGIEDNEKGPLKKQGTMRVSLRASAAPTSARTGWLSPVIMIYRLTHLE